ncbi:hypothetical protein TNIN_371821 [Trichonephila inaurata madagascariensis]|uniref:Uncharacterized protein n=1 Tax=Trichonephila inaurata madagascariensis TaxID=2747483 RepID=A0A8X6J6G8_9ARAC|nr:hypothetical protein TNIN_371821 [Trichonephila inaurata madagascariensis]
MYLPTQVANCRPPPRIGMEKKSPFSLIYPYGIKTGDPPTLIKKDPCIRFAWQPYRNQTSATMPRKSLFIQQCSLTIDP